ncbi:DUF3775 domain-containing protein [Pelagibius litoralis]|uniref:DUF3775 domain-containing protein n=1 Tax=Pelagibius litoralis TaxID=374515 RepID=A0A967F1E3_9PROT|nr:DUF3775 domain-containing protein [Pelagibius litoralis]NIA71181.1 DUF3775 domain-containing protein [Pelagibius litoralis]
MAKVQPAALEPEVIELDLNPGTVCFLIAKARAFDVKVAAPEQDTVSQPGEDDMHDVLEDYGDDPVAEEIRQVIEDLNEEQQAELVAMIWVGRGDFDRSEWPAALAAANERHTGPSSAYLLGMPLFGDLLEEGFTTLGHRCEDEGNPV